MYTEEDQYDVKFDSPKQKQEDKKLITMLLIVFGLIFIVIITIIVCINVFSNKVFLPVVSLSTSNWTNSNVVLTVDTNNDKNINFSFDGGKTWTDQNSFTVEENMDVVVMVKNKKGKTSKKATITIQNIDKEGPIVNFVDPLYIQRGEDFQSDLNSIMIDSGSGVKDYTVEPPTIDTSVDGEYQIVYKVNDLVGNITEKNRTVRVGDWTGLTYYYRSRTVELENYQCEPYECSCVKCDTTTAEAVISCPTGYELSGNKCLFGDDIAAVLVSCPSGYTLYSGTTCKAIKNTGQCCKTCYRTCQREKHGEWNDWTTTELKPGSKIQVESKVE